jgi:hypothetical protein
MLAVDIRIITGMDGLNGSGGGFLTFEIGQPNGPAADSEHELR